MTTHSVICFENVTLRIRDKPILSGATWDIKEGQNWVILGPNGAGKSSLVRALIGELPVVKGKIVFPADPLFGDKIALVSFESHRRLIEREDRRDAARDFSGRPDDVTTVLQLILADLPQKDSRPEIVEHVVDQMKIRHLLTRGIRFLSTGEMRKVLISRALMRSPRMIIFDEPFDGLDFQSRGQLARIIDTLMNDRRQVILVTHRLAEVLANFSHLLGVREGCVLFQGARECMLTPEWIDRLYTPDSAPISGCPRTPLPRDCEPAPLPDVLVEMKDTTVKYGDVAVLEALNWSMRTGENWAITGPNGAGKTTLLSLIAADNNQAYANEIYLFGRRRGSGESIWDIKQQIGIVSSEFQIRYRQPITAFEVILSGFFDSVGLYHHGTSAQKEIAAQWIEVFQIGHLAPRQFRQLSDGEQRMVLLARAMVKFPRLLILDEPCQGLDRINRKKILDLVEFIGRCSRTQLLFVTHYSHEIPACITHTLQLGKTSEGKFQARQTPA